MIFTVTIFSLMIPIRLDEHGHGTHVSGTIGAVGNNSIGVVGVNWNVKIMAIKIYNSTGFGTTSAMLINAYNYVRLMKERGVNIRVTNNSYSGCDEACGYDQATKDALDALGNANVLNVFAAGNDARNIETDSGFSGKLHESERFGGRGFDFDGCEIGVFKFRHNKR